MLGLYLVTGDHALVGYRVPREKNMGRADRGSEGARSLAALRAGFVVGIRVYGCDVLGYRVCGWGLIKAHSVESYPKIVFSRIYPKFCLANAWIQLSI